MAQVIDEELETHVIPENFVDTGRCFNGLFRTRNLIEGVIFAALPAYLCINAPLGYEKKIILTVVVVGVIMAVMLSGINGDSVLEFVGHGLAFKKKKRVAKYNPRVKTEARPGYLTEGAGDLPRDKIIRLYNSFRNRNAETQEAVSRDIYDPMYKEFFEDDLGYVETPDDLKTKKERRREMKAKKREEKARKAAEKAAARAEKKAEKKRSREELRELKKTVRDTDKEIQKERARLKREGHDIEDLGGELNEEA